MFKKLCIIVANSSASLIAKSSALLVADYIAQLRCPDTVDYGSFSMVFAV
jgi:hypothetical protein